MGSYYTNVFRKGDTLLVREIKDGKRHKYRVNYKPTLYVASKEPSKFKSPTGKNLVPTYPGSMGDCFHFMKKYKNSGGSVFGSTNYQYVYLNETYPGEVAYNINDIVVCNLDIEVSMKGGASTPEAATQPITAITIRYSKDQKFHVFGCKTYHNTSKEVIYYKCNNEIDLLERFLMWWEHVAPDVVIGWNIEKYDFVYLRNRIKNQISEKAVNRLSPWGVVKERTVKQFGSDMTVYEFAGVNLMDYYLIYEKNVLEPRENYKLDYIAEVELGENKLDYSKYSSLDELYEHDFQTFVEYNIHDVRLVDRIDEKRKLIELQMIVAYDAKVNYSDVLSPLKVWDAKICNKLMEDNIVPPQREFAEKKKFVGGSCLKPIPGMYDWIVTIDAQSLYPNIMRSLNISLWPVPDNELTPQMIAHRKYLKENAFTYDEEGTEVVDYQAVVKGMTPALNQHLKDHDLSVAVNGTFYRRKPQSFYSLTIEKLFDSRLDYKAKLKEVKKLLKDCAPERKQFLLNQETNFDLKQSSIKILMNALFGCCGNVHYRFYKLEIAEAITSTGQFIIQYVRNSINDFINKEVGTVNHRYLVASDTDSVMLSLAPLLYKHVSKDATLEEKCDFLDNYANTVLIPESQRLIQEILSTYLNGVDGYLRFVREIIGDKGLWTSKKHYIINVRDKEGSRKPNLKASLKVMGLEIKKATVPKFSREAMKDAVQIIMDKDEETLHQLICETKKKFMKLSIEEISFPRSVTGIIKYADPEHLHIKRTPINTKGALLFNHLVDTFDLQSKVEKIKDGEKIKFVYIKENPYRINVVAFITALPKEMQMHQYIDYETQWQKAFIEPMMLILKAIGWHTEKQASLDDLFE